MVELVLGAGRDTSSAELAKALGLTRESVYQLLLPLVRAGYVDVGRGRNGGYRAASGAAALPVSEAMAPFSRDAGRNVHRTKEPPVIEELERRATEAYRRVFASVTVGEVAAAVRASREALSWEI